MNKETLINAVYARREIWDKHLTTHRDRNKVDSQWDEVAKECGAEKTYVKKTWKNLQDHFRTIWNGLKRKKCGDGLEDVEELIGQVKWAYFRQLLFLKDVVGGRNTSLNITDVADGSPPEETSTTADFTTFCSRMTEYSESGMVIKSDAVTDAATPSTSSQSAHSVDEVPLPTDAVMETPPIITRTRRKTMKRQHYESEIQKIDYELTKIGTELREPRDNVSRFVEHLADIIREVPHQLQRKCMMDLLHVANTYADNAIVVVGTAVQTHCDNDRETDNVHCQGLVQQQFAD